MSEINDIDDPCLNPPLKSPRLARTVVGAPPPPPLLGGGGSHLAQKAY